MKKLPIYKAVVNFEDNTGIEVLSFVPFPATESSFIAFDKDKEFIKFSVDNEEQRMVRGLVMEADAPIYRRSGDIEYYIVFDKQTLKTMAEKWLMGFQNNFDENHNFNLVDGVQMQQVYIKDVENGINPKGFEDVNDGSLFCTAHINNDDVWNAIKDGTFTGFSLAGAFEVAEVKEGESFNDEEVDEDFSACMQLIEQLQNKIKNAK